MKNIITKDDDIQMNATNGSARFLTRWGGSVKLLAISVLTWLILLANRTSGSTQQGEEAEQLLQKCIKALSALDYVEIHGSSEIHLLVVTDDRPRHQQDRYVYRRMGDKLDIAGEYEFYDKNQSSSFHYRVVNDGKYRILTNYRLRTETKPRTGITTEKCNNYSDTAAKFMELDGLFDDSDGKRLPQLMLESGAASIHGVESINGMNCTVVRADTRYGIVKLWITAGEGFTIRKVSYEKRISDAMSDGKTLSQFPKIIRNGKELTVIRINREVSDVITDIIDSRHVAVKGKLTKTTEYNDGRKDVSESVISRKEIHFSPNFDGTDAFKTDLPEGATVSNQDDAQSGVSYVWRKGKVVPAYTEFDSRAEGFFAQRTFWTIAVWIGIGCLLLFLSYWVISRSSKSQGK